MLLLKKSACGLFIIPLISIFSFLLCHLYDQLWFTISSMWLYSFLCIWLYNRNSFVDPRAVFPPFFSFYYTWYALSISLGRQPRLFSIDEVLLHESVVFSYFCLLVFINCTNLIFILLNSETKLNFHMRTFFKPSQFSELCIMTFCFLISILSSIILLRSGVSSKNEATQLGGFFGIAYLFTFFLSIGVMIRVYRLSHINFFKDPLIFGFVLYSILYMTITGERDIIFRFFVVSLFIIGYKFKRLDFYKVLLLLVSIAIIVPMSQLAKSILLSGPNLLIFTPESILGNEFVSAGRNLYTLFYFSVENNPLTMLTDLVRAFAPSSICDIFSITSTNVWFNSVFRFEHNFSGSAGWGFGLVPQAYLMGGYLGGFIYFSVLSFIVSLVFLKINKNEYWAVLYFISMASLIYCLRADLSNYLSQSFKVGGILIWSYFILSKLFRRGIRETKP